MNLGDPNYFLRNNDAEMKNCWQHQVRFEEAEIELHLQTFYAPV